MATCRFCRKWLKIEGRLLGVKYGVRHYAHFHCYLDAGKRLEDLHEWQVATFPWALLKARNLLALAEDLTEPDPDPENIYNLPSMRQSIHAA